MSKGLGSGTRPSQRPTTRTVGGQGEARALAHLQAAGLALVARNFKSPGRGGGEVDLIMREPDGTLVFVEVRQRHPWWGSCQCELGQTAANHFCGPAFPGAPFQPAAVPLRCGGLERRCRR